MRRGRISALAAVALCAAIAGAGCGLGPGDADEGEATLTVTRDYGAEVLVDATVSDPAESDTVLRVLDREAEVTTRYGGGFVYSIDGVAGGIDDGRSADWFFYVDGVESETGAADVAIAAGDRIWWDYRDWTDAMRVPAVVGSWPEPFAQVSADADRAPVRIVCAGARGPCDAASEQLSEEGVDASIEAASRGGGSPDADAMRILVGSWDEIRGDPVAGQLAAGPPTSGVFGQVTRATSSASPAGVRGGYQLVLLDETGDTVRTLGPGAGLVAALRGGEEPPTWLVTGTDADGVAEAVAALDEDDLRDRYAVAASGGATIALPVVAPEG